MNIKGVCYAIAAALSIVVLAVGLAPDAFRSAQFDDGVVRIQIDRTSGSGVAIGPNTVATAAHVVMAAYRGLEPDQPPRPIQVFGRNQEPVTAHVLWMNTDYDLAVIETDKPLARARALACRAPVPGEALTVVGYPSISGGTIRGPVITRGIVASFTRINRQGVREHVITDARVQPGNSGGPAFDAGGRIIGIAVAMFGIEFDLPRPSNGPPNAYGPGGQPPRAQKIFVPNGYSLVVPSSTLCRFLGRV